MENEIYELSEQDFPELERINAEFEDFDKFANHRMIIHEASIENVELDSGEKFDSAVMWCYSHTTQHHHLVRSSGMRVKSMIKAIIAQDKLPILCVFTKIGKSQAIVPPNSVPF